MNWVHHSPPDIGGVDATSRRSREASFNGADGLVQNGTSSKERIPQHFGNPDPVCGAKEPSRHFIDAAATPPVSGGEWRGHTLLIPQSLNGLQFRRGGRRIE